MILKKKVLQQDKRGYRKKTEDKFVKQNMKCYSFTITMYLHYIIYSIIYSGTDQTICRLVAVYLWYSELAFRSSILMSGNPITT